jgi:DNA-binding transcriptional ArsR family regulator
MKHPFRPASKLVYMNAIHPIASMAELIGDPARSGMLIALLDGRSLPAGELAARGGVSAQSASGHLSKLVNGGLLKVQSAGRHRYYALANSQVAYALEALGAISTSGKSAGSAGALANSLPMSEHDRALRTARTCYDHLAGRIAVQLTGALEQAGVLRRCGDADYELGKNAGVWCDELRLDVAALRSARRSFARQCLDWTERRPHLAGALGAALCARLVDLGWIARRPRTRAVRITHAGARELQRRFGIAVSAQG